MKRIEKTFCFTYSNSKKVVRNLRIVSEEMPVKISGTAYFYPYAPKDEQVEVDIDEVIWHGKDVWPLFSHMDQEGDFVDAAIMHMTTEFRNEREYLDFEEIREAI